MKQKDRDMLIVINERVKCLPKIKEDVESIGIGMVENRTKLDMHLADKDKHSKLDSSNGMKWPGKLVNWALKKFNIIT